MPQKETIDNLVDPKVYDELDKLLDKLMINSLEVEKFNTALASSKGFNAINTNSKKVNDALKQLVDTQNRVAQTQEKINQTRLDSTFDRQAAAVTRASAAESKALRDSTDQRKQLTLALKDQEVRYANLYLTQGKNAAITLEAKKGVLETRAVLDDLNNGIGRYGDNVRNYSSAFTGYANTLRGLRGPTKLLGEALGLGAQEADQFRLILEHSFQGIAAFFRGKESKAAASAAAATATAAETAAETAQTASQTVNTAATEANTVATEGAAVAETELAVATTGASTAMKVFRFVAFATGIGIVIGLIALAVVKYREYSSAAEKAAQQQRDLNDAINEVSKNANKDSATQIDTLKFEYAAATDVNNAMELRIKAADKLKDTFPETFKNSKTSAILNGEEAKSLKKLRDEILQNAKATAAKAKIDEIAAKILGSDFQQEKIRNANKREIIAAAKQAQDETQKLNYQNSANGRNLAGSDVTKNIEQGFIRQSNARAKDALNDEKSKQAALTRQAGFLTDFAGGATKIGNALSTTGDKKDKKVVDTTAKDLTAGFNEAIETEKKRNELIQQNDQSSYDKRLQSIDEFQKKSVELINERTIAELKNNKLPQQQKLNIAQKGEIDVTGIEIEAQKEKQKVGDDVLKDLEKQYAVEINLAKKHDDAVINSIKTTTSEKLKQIEIDKNQALDGLLDQYEKGKLTTKKYEDQVSQITFQAAEDRAKTEIASYQTIIDAKKAAGQDTTNEQLALDKIEADSAKRLNDIKLKQLDQLKSAQQQLQQLQKELTDALINLALTGLNAILDFAGKQKEITNQKDAVTKQEKIETDAVNRSIGSQQQKADKIAVINAQAAAKQEALDKRSAELKRKQAQAEKLENIGKALAAIALSEIQALSYLTNPLTFYLYPEIATYIAAVGAAQLAALAFAPIPSYFTGTESSVAGKARVGELGVELVKEPSGKKWLTPEVPTIVDLVGGSKIINNKELMQSLARPPQFQNITHDIDIKELILEQRANNRELKAVKEAILAGQRQPPRRGVNYNDSRFNIYYEGLKK